MTRLAPVAVLLLAALWAPRSARADEAGGAATSVDAEAPAVQPARSPFALDLGFGVGRLEPGSAAPSQSSALSIGLAYAVAPTLQLTFGTRALDFGRGAAEHFASLANMELGVRWSPFGRLRTTAGAALVPTNIQFEAGVGLARRSRGAWDGYFSTDDRTFGLGYSAGLRWLPAVTESYAAGLSLTYLGQEIDGEHGDAVMAGFAIEFGR